MTATQAPDSTSGTSTSQAVEKADTSPRALVKQYEDSFAAVLPSHIKPATWVRIAQGALKKGKRLPSGQYELEVAAQNNPAIFLSTLLDAARMGLEPGTDEYYLTPREVKGTLQILGIVGYQGIVELIYRAGAASSVVVECVYEKDGFEYSPGIHERPIHTIDWDAEERGALRLAYAYAVMKDGATSKVVVLNRHDISRIKAKAQNPTGKYSPWVTNEPAMWLKSAARQLRKWVPTSAEYIREQLRAERDVAEEGKPNGESAASLGAPDLPAGADVDGYDGDIIDAESFEEGDYEPGGEPFDPPEGQEW